MAQVAYPESLNISAMEYCPGRIIIAASPLAMSVSSRLQEYIPVRSE